MGSFADQVGAWCLEAPERLAAARRTALGLLATELARTKADGGTLPKVTGNLMNSLLASTAGLPTVAPSGTTFTGTDPGAAIADLDFGQDLWFGYRAAYARRMNYGFVGEDGLGRTYDQAGNHFVERAVTLWPHLVADAAQKVRGMPKL